MTSIESDLNIRAVVFGLTNRAIVAVIMLKTTLLKIRLLTASGAVIVHSMNGHRVLLGTPYVIIVVSVDIFQKRVNFLVQ